MLTDSAASLTSIELRLRSLLPAELYAAVWLEPFPDHLMQVFQHLRTLQYILQDYIPRQVSEMPPQPGRVQHSWQEGTLLFTDLAGFTPLMEANAAHGDKGAAMLLNLLNRYFSEMLEIVSKSGGDLLEFTGDALLIQFLADKNPNDTVQAVRAGLRMQRAMAHFREIETVAGRRSLGMRIGIHSGKFLTADIGTPMRMAHVLLGNTVQLAKQAEGAGKVGRVCLTQTVIDRLQGQFHCEPVNDHYALVKDDLTSDELGEYDITVARRRLSSPLLFDRSSEGLIAEISELVRRVEPLASYLPLPILNLVVENAAQRQIPPDFPEATVLFVNLIGLPESVDRATPSEVDRITNCFSNAFALIHAAVKSRGGILQKITYHLIGSDILIYFGVLETHPDNAIRAAETAIAVRDIVNNLPILTIAHEPLKVAFRIGITCGSVFAAEIGEPRGRREFNILGDPVNTASRLASYADRDQILLTDNVYSSIRDRFPCGTLGAIALKGKSQPMPLYELSD